MAIGAREEKPRVRFQYSTSTRTTAAGLPEVETARLYTRDFSKFRV